MIKNKHIAGKTIKNISHARSGLPIWGIKAIYRLAQLRQPGAHSLTLVVKDDGRRQLMVDGGKVEELGK